MEEAVVLYPSPPIGHVIAMVELGKLLLTHQPSISVHILIATPPYQADSTAPYIAAVSSTVTSIVFHKLPKVILPPSPTVTHHESLTFEVLRLNNPNVLQALLSISKDYKVRAFIMDFFCTVAFQVASGLNIPPYFFFTSGVSCLSSFLYLPTLHNKTTKSFKELKVLLNIPGLPPVPSADMPKPVLDRNDEVYEIFLNNSTYLPKAAGIIINSFESLESRAMEALSHGLCVPNGPTPPLYCIGPLIADIDRRSGVNSCDGVPDCLLWLDKQPSKSVVFLCFGSLGLFSVQQLKEIAVGLERSGQRFLWVVRNPPSENLSVAIKEQAEPDLEALLPMGFLDRTRDMGKVVKSWAPQVTMLNHESIGGFVTHCGWNSVLESVCSGVPMVAWPLYAEQRFNRVLLVQEMKIALPMVESETGFVDSSEVEKGVRELMESEQGKLIRERTIAMEHDAMAAMREGGSSRLALAKLFESWKKG
ncbi:Anthocyanidin 5,3-O-glucosyltransferase [Hibiscus syriacus]|uniref:Glycosyltransferase n=1 Tax=Hibiscus syriacus TaxID=106335 RepID=A0A6A2YK62_HIBSY|nr:UDP-glycosyltransferase 88A1 [Hibiscus syriacus]KAE8678277.1 Anthocyanidin 5,3-O-glucosyltransferase [Hibiscus syriacus]